VGARAGGGGGGTGAAGGGGRGKEAKVGDGVGGERDLEGQLEDLQGTAERGNVSDADLQAAHARIAQLESEVERADNVRQFAANTEREIAGLERELREMKAKVAQVTLERDRYESQPRNVRDDSETGIRQVGTAARADAESTEKADLSRYTALVARASELEQKLMRLEKDDAQLRRSLQEAEAKVAQRKPDGGGQMSEQMVEYLNVIEESIDSLRANMRAASDETAMMDPSESVSAVSSAVSQAAEHVERARDSLRALNTLMSRG